MKSWLLLFACFLQLSWTIQGKWVDVMAKENLVRLKRLREKIATSLNSSVPKDIAEVIAVTSDSVAVGTTTARSNTKNLVVSGRQNVVGGMNFPSLETSLTTLAFLSFGAFLLSMLMRALNITNSGRGKRDLDLFSVDGDSFGGIYDFHDAALLALDALRSAVFNEEIPSCAARRLCKIFRNAERAKEFARIEPVLVRTALNLLHEKAKGYGIPSNWTTVVQMMMGQDCLQLFPLCDEDVARAEEMGKEMDSKGRFPGGASAQTQSAQNREHGDSEKLPALKPTRKWLWTRKKILFDEHSSSLPTKTDGT